MTSRTATTFVLVRHAHAGDKRSWPRPDTERPLSKSGRLEAAGLTVSLDGVPITRLLTSPYRRCRETLAPLSLVTGLAVQDCQLLVPDAELAALDELLADPAQHGTVYCTHGETLDALFQRWRQLKRTREPALATPKGAAWIVTHHGAQPQIRYRPPQRLSLPG